MKKEAMETSGSDEAKQLARLLKVLSVATRVRILQMLKKRPLCVMALASRLEVTQGAVSQHLRVMRDAGLVIDDKRGYFVHYSINKNTVIAWQAAIERLLSMPDVDDKNDGGGRGATFANGKTAPAMGEGESA